MKKYLLLFICATFIFSCKKEDASSARKAPIPDQTEINKLKINQLQTIGSHNSYHKRTDPAILDFLNNLSFILPANLQPSDLDYEHEPLDIQLNTYGMRSFEIDIYADPTGGRFYNRKGNSFANKPEASGIAELNQPGFKIMHIPDIDFNTHFYTFKSALSFFKTWSDNNPNHLPIVILLETKEDTPGDVLGFLGFKTALPFTPAVCDEIDNEIKSVFGNNLDKIITPDRVRGSYTTLREAVLAGNWPTVGDARGKFLFVMLGSGKNDYLAGHPSLENRAMFTFAAENKPEAAFVQYDDPTEYQDSIQLAVGQGFIVRARADDPNKQNRTGDYTEMNNAFSSGAQVISTDYYRPDPRYLTQPNLFKNYTCKFPNGELARINPISAADKQGIGTVAE